MARRANLIHPGLLVGIVVLVLGLATAIFIAIDKNDKLEVAVKAKNSALKKAKQFEDSFVQEKTRRINEGRYIFGWDSNGQGGKTLDFLEGWMLDKFEDRIDPKFQTKEDRLKDLVRKKIVLTDYDIPDAKFIEFQKQVQKDYEETKTQLETEIENLKADREKIKTELENEIDNKQNQIDDLNVQIGDYTQRIETAAEDRQVEVSSLNLKLEDLRSQIRFEQRNSRLEISRLNRQIDDLEDRLDEAATDRSGQLTPDGEIINIDASIQTDTAYINLGQEDKVTRGMRFEVFQWGPGGEQLKKGEVVVREVNQYTSKVGIISLVSELDPMVVGDLVANIAYDPKKQRSFVLVGNFENFTKDELKRLIEREGGIVEELVQSGLDYAVVGRLSEDEDDPESKRYKQVKDFRIPLLNEREIRQYLRDYSN